MVNVLHIGLGYWGPGVARNLMNIEEVKLVAVCDQSEDAYQKTKRQFPGVAFARDYHEFLRDSQIDAVSIATPAQSHFQMVQKSLEHGKHVLIEKPLAMSSKEARCLLQIAKERNLVLMVGHVFLYNPAVRKLKELYESGELGEIYYLYSQRLNLGRVRQDVDVLWNFCPHDFSIMMFLLDRKIESISARGLSMLQPGISDVAFIQVTFEGGIGCHVHVSWIDPNKVRRMTIVGSKKMAVYDDVRSDRKIQVFDRGIHKGIFDASFGSYDNFGSFQFLVRAGDIFIPKIDATEPLYLECRHFVECIVEGKTPLTDGLHGLRVVEALEAASHSMQNNGAMVSVRCANV